MNPIQLLFAKIRYQLFVWRIEWEIFDRIFPHLQNEADYRYPFNSDDEIEQICQDSPIAALPFAKQIEREIKRMPKGYGLAFRYILHRELKARRKMSGSRMKMFQMLAHRRVDQETCDPRFVARRAT